jgi:hypothetical protein
MHGWSPQTPHESGHILTILAVEHPLYSSRSCSQVSSFPVELSVNEVDVGSTQLYGGAVVGVGVGDGVVAGVGAGVVGGGVALGALRGT